MKRFMTLAGAAMCVALVAPGTASAEPGGKGGDKAAHGGAHGGKGAAKSNHAGDHRMAKPAKASAAATKANGNMRRASTDPRVDDFFDRSREAEIRRYYGTAVSCPPGLAAKNNGCLPPGQAKKTYGVGTILPSGIALASLPGDLISRLPTAPDGYYYGRYNGDVYLVENATRRIIDTVVFNLLR